MVVLKEFCVRPWGWIIAVVGDEDISMLDLGVYFFEKWIEIVSFYEDCIALFDCTRI